MKKALSILLVLTMVCCLVQPCSASQINPGDGVDQDLGYDSYSSDGFIAPEFYDEELDAIECNAACRVELLGENGECITYDISPEEMSAGADFPVYMPVDENSTDGPVTMSLNGYVRVATFSIQRTPGGTIYWCFTPTSLGIAILTLGFTGTARLTNFSGLSCGTFFYAGRMAGSIPTSPGRRIFIMTGVYSVLGYKPVDISFYYYI